MHFSAGLIITSMPEDLCSRPFYSNELTIHMFFAYWQVSKEVQNLMMKSLHYCQDEECEAKSPRIKSIRLRIGTIHHRIASLYHHALRNKVCLGAKDLLAIFDRRHSF